MSSNGRANNASTTHEDLTAFYGEPISTYSRAEAIKDGVLVDLTNHPELGGLVNEAGIRYHVAITREAFEMCVALTPAAVRACNDLKGRCWDVLWMMRNAIHRVKDGRPYVLFPVYCVVKRVKPTRVTLKAVVGHGDDAEPVITVMLLGQD